MSKVIKSKNIVSIKRINADRENDEKGQGCVKCTNVHNRATLLVTKSDSGKKNIWHEKCFNLHYGKAVKPEGKAKSLLAKFIKIKTKVVKVEETSEGLVEIDKELTELDESDE